MHRSTLRSGLTRARGLGVPLWHALRTGRRRGWVVAVALTLLTLPSLTASSAQERVSEHALAGRVAVLESCYDAQPVGLVEYIVRPNQEEVPLGTKAWDDLYLLSATATSYEGEFLDPTTVTVCDQQLIAGTSVDPATLRVEFPTLSASNVGMLTAAKTGQVEGFITPRHDFSEYPMDASSSQSEWDEYNRKTLNDLQRYAAIMTLKTQDHLTRQTLGHVFYLVRATVAAPDNKVHWAYARSALVLPTGAVSTTVSAGANDTTTKLSLQEADTSGLGAGVLQMCQKKYHHESGAASRGTWFSQRGPQVNTLFNLKAGVGSTRTETDFWDATDGWGALVFNIAGENPCSNAIQAGVYQSIEGGQTTGYNVNTESNGTPTRYDAYKPNCKYGHFATGNGKAVEVCELFINKADCNNHTWQGSFRNDGTPQGC